MGHVLREAARSHRDKGNAYPRRAARHLIVSAARPVLHTVPAPKVERTRY